MEAEELLTSRLRLNKVPLRRAPAPFRQNATTPLRLLSITEIKT